MARNHQQHSNTPALHHSSKKWGGQRDSNPQQPEPQSGALPLSYDHRLTQILGLRFAIAKAKVRAAYWNIGILPVSAEDSRLKAHWAHWLKKPMFQFSAWHTLR